jgi:gluconolactonase
MFLSHIEVVKPAFAKLMLMNTHLEKIWTGGRWLEGPAWFAAARYLVFSDIPNNRMLRFDETDSSVSTFRQPSMHSNGNTRDQSGRLITCEHLTRRVTRTEHDGTITIIADRFKGKRLNSPNDVVVADDGAIWFTDPTYGIDSDYEGACAPSEIGENNLYRVDAQSGVNTVMAADFVQPNGLAFSPDGKVLYVVDSGVTHKANGPRHIRKYVLNGTALKGGDVISECAAGLYDGIRVDARGNLWVGAGDGVHCLDGDGDLIGKIRVPEVVANLCFGGAQRNRLFICGTTSLYSTFVNVSAQ